MLSAILAGGLAAYGLHESRRHRRHLARLPLRVHVNGTRGKSSVTRLIAGGLRAGGRKTFAKTTGTMARLIHTDGSEADVYRVGGANVVEQMRVVRIAADEGAEALVIECMAVLPELQPLAELRLIRSHVGVITNARADHLDVMGPTVDDVARALAQTAPVGGHLFTAERERAGILESIASERGSVMHVVVPEGTMEDDLRGFSYIEHAENLALALAVCAHLGVERATALRGMHEANPDPGVLQRYTIRSGAKEVVFVNAFAANDPDSTALIWERLGLDSPETGVRTIILANCRIDRPQRSGQIAGMVSTRLRADSVVLAGEDTDIVALLAIKAGLPRQRLANLGGRDAASVYEHVLSLVEDRAIVVGIGNIVGLGEEIVLHFKNRSVANG